MKHNRLKYLKTSPPIEGFQSESLPIAISKIDLKSGDWAEFGVGKGVSTRRIYDCIKDKTILHLFDSFEGLPEDWIRKNDCLVKKGRFACDPPDWIFTKNNIKVYKGLFKDTLLEFVESQKKKLGFINIDCDLYSSTKTVFENLDGLISIGTIIHFDEYYNYDGWEYHEFKAFMEYTTDWDRDFEYLGRTNHCQVWVKITK